MHLDEGESKTSMEARQEKKEREKKMMEELQEKKEGVFGWAQFLALSFFGSALSWSGA
jgi:hypothetical protein